jgi:D-galactarolactone cycloisomerase
MKIASLEFIPVKVPFPAPFRPAWIPDTTLAARRGTIIRLRSDNGVTGYGWQNSSGMEIKICGESNDFQKHVLGLELSAFEKVLPYLSTLGIKMYGVEVAMWDALGKSVGQPISKLLGGAQDRVLAYASTAEMKKPEEQAKDALKYWDKGFRAIKIRSHHEKMEDDLAVIRAIRGKVPREMQIMVDANQASPTSGPLVVRASTKDSEGAGETRCNMARGASLPRGVREPGEALFRCEHRHCGCGG